MTTLTRLHWTHPIVGDIDEVACERHLADVRAALYVLGIGCAGDGVEGSGDPVACLRCHAHPAKPPRELLRQWFGGAA